MHSMAVEYFKIIRDLIPRCLSDLVSFRKIKHNFRYSNILETHVPKMRTSSYGKMIFRYAAPAPWNSLPENV